MILSVATKTTLGSHCVLKILRKSTTKSFKLLFIGWFLNVLSIATKTTVGSCFALEILRKSTRNTSRTYGLLRYEDSLRSRLLWTQKKRLVWGVFGCPTRIRTWASRTKIWCATITPWDSIKVRGERFSLIWFFSAVLKAIAFGKAGKVKGDSLFGFHISQNGCKSTNFSRTDKIYFYPYCKSTL